MKRAALVAALCAGMLACRSGERTFEAPLSLGGAEVAPEVLNRGELVYMQHCRACHGQDGRGDGRYSVSLNPRPANLTSGEYPRLGATDGRLPTDEALRRLIAEGIEGTGMGPQPISGENLDAVVQYLKTLSPVWRAGAGYRVQ